MHQTMPLLGWLLLPLPLGGQHPSAGEGRPAQLELEIRLGSTRFADQPKHGQEHLGRLAAEQEGTAWTCQSFQLSPLRGTEHVSEPAAKNSS